MDKVLLSILRCPVSRSELQPHILSSRKKIYNGEEHEVIENAILYAAEDWFYPVINGIPCLLVEACIDYKDFLQQHMPDFAARKEQLFKKYGSLVHSVARKNSHSKQSFALEWSLFNYKEDKTWDLPPAGMLQQFLDETGESADSLQGKLIFDAGCGNGKLNPMIAGLGARILGMDFSRSVERAYEHNTNPHAWFIQGDVQFPPVAFDCFDIVHSSGVLIHTASPELSFSCIAPCVK
ncbi:MAG TPA: methyltransferase domain-containing protein, partial [Chitinophagaceae bacterium]